jgi:Calcineurin-like phosphoesterase
MASPGRPPRLRQAHNLQKLNASPTLHRFSIVNHFNRRVDKLAATTRFPRLQAFLPQNLGPWFWSYLKNAFTPRYAFQTYKNAGKNGVYDVSRGAGYDRLTIGIAGDWGTGTAEASTIAKLMDQRFDFTIHLGDVYYVGDADEIRENCLGEKTALFDGVTWPYGTRGSFAMNGNHEMLANGKPYFQIFLPRLGMKGDTEGQVASFFCLEADQWRIIALDTGYNSVGVPLLSMIPGVNSIPFIGGDCHLEGDLRTWLRDVVQVKSKPKATLILSHHQYYTAFSDKAYTKPAKQLAEFFGTQEVVWIWGHEHRLSIYDKFRTDGGITAYGRCAGHSGMPVETGDPATKDVPLKFYDPRTRELPNGATAGYNGYLILSIQGDALSIEYWDIDQNKLLVEQFRAGAKGTLTYQLIDSSGLKPPPSV